MSISYDFSGQTAIVTGGARGIGRAVATQFVRSGAHVWIWDVDPIELDGAQSLNVDVTNSDQIAKAVAHVLSQSPRIDILVNDAGYLGSYHPFEQLDTAEWERILRINLMSVFEVTRQVLPLMRRCGIRADRQHGFPRRQGRFTKPRSIFGCKCGSNRVHKGSFPRGLRYQHSDKLRCARLHRHRSNSKTR